MKTKFPYCVGMCEAAMAIAARDLEGRNPDCQEVARYLRDTLRRVKEILIANNGDLAETPIAQVEK